MMLSHQEVQPSKLVVKTQLSNHNNFTLSFQRFQDSISWNPRIRNPRSWGLRILDSEDWGSLILRIKDPKILNKYLKLGFQDLGSSILGLSILDPDGKSHFYQENVASEFHPGVILVPSRHICTRYHPAFIQVSCKYPPCVIWFP